LLIIDTDIASAFAKAGHFDVLMKLFGTVGIDPCCLGKVERISVAPLVKIYVFTRQC
jgi:hypothetical protein